jgi:hypothetical protein
MSFLRQLLTQSLGPYIGPIPFNIVQGLGMRGLTVNYPPTRGNISEGGPQAVLLLIVNQNEEASAFIIKRVGLHQITYNTESKPSHGCDQTVTSGPPYRLCGRNENSTSGSAQP